MPKMTVVVTAQGEKVARKKAIIFTHLSIALIWKFFNANR
jgi:hypothetical protein